VPGVDDDHLVDQRRAGVPEALGLPQRLSVAADHLAAEAPERGHRLRSVRAVRHEADLALEAGHRAGRPAAEHAVGKADVEAHLGQALLELAYVVTDERVGDGVVERTVTERPLRGLQRAPRLVAHPAVHVQAAALLEGPYGVLGGRVELGARP